MALHRLTSVTIGVPNVAETAAYYTEFGLAPAGGGVFSTVDGGEQLRLVESPARRLVELGIGAENLDDLARIARSMAHLNVAAEAGDGVLTAVDEGTEVRVRITVAEPITQAAKPALVYNGPGRDSRLNARAPGIERADPVTPRKLGHVVLGSTDTEGSQRFFTEGLGFKVSDNVPGIASFLRCSSDHHNVLVPPAPVP